METPTSEAALSEWLRSGVETIRLALGPSSEFPSLKRAVQAHISAVKERNPPVQASKKWVIGWSGLSGTTYGDSSELMDLFATIAMLEEVRIFVLLPLRPGDLLKLVQVVIPGEAFYMRFDPLCDQGGTQEENEKEALEVLNEISSWNIQRNLSFSLSLPFFLEPKGRFLSKLAKVMPEIELKELRLYLKEPPSGIVSEQDFFKDLEGAIEKVQDGLEKNYSLQEFFVGPSDRDGKTKLRKFMTRMMVEKCHPLLHLNERGRGHVVSLPLHRDTWLEIVSRFTNDCNLDAVFYYLRKNTWMFTPELDLEAQDRRLRAQVEEIDNMKKRLREKDIEMQALEKRLKAELGSEKKRHNAELEAKDQEIRKLQAQLSRGETVN